MSETPTSSGEPSITTRVEALERQMNAQAQNAGAIVALVHSLDRFRSEIDARFNAVEGRLDGMGEQLAALNRSNQLLAELITARLPPPPPKNDE